MANWIQPSGLGGEETFDIRGISCVFVSGRKKVLFPNDAESLLLAGTEFRLLKVEAAFFEGAGDLPPGNGGLSPLGFVCFPDRGLLLGTCRGYSAQVLLFRHVAARNVIEHGGVDMGKKPKLLDGADGEGESGANRIVGPMIGAKSLDGAPLVDGSEGDI